MATALGQFPFPYKTFGTVLAGSGETTCYTNSTGNIVFLFEVRCAVEAGTAGAATVRWYDASTTTHFQITKSEVIPANTALILSFPPLALGPLDLIKVTSAASVDIIITVAEYAGRSA